MDLCFWFVDIISKENSINRLASLHDCCDNPHKKFELSDVMYLIKSGIEVSRAVLMHLCFILM